MFLIEYDKGRFINAENIDLIEVDASSIIFSISGAEVVFSVDVEFMAGFVNSVELLNNNIHDVEHRFHQVYKGE